MDAKTRSVKRGYSIHSKILTSRGIKYIDEVTEEDKVYTYNIKKGSVVYKNGLSYEVLKDNFFNLTEFTLEGYNSVLTSPSNPVVITTKSGLKVSHSSGVIKDTKILVGAINEVNSIDFIVDRYLKGLLDSAINYNFVKATYEIVSKNPKELSDSLRGKQISHSLTKKGKIRILEPIEEIGGGISEDIWTKAYNIRLSYILGVLEGIGCSYTEDGKLEVVHSNIKLIEDLSYLMLITGFIPYEIVSGNESIKLIYCVPINIRKLYKSYIYDGLLEYDDILSERRQIKIEGGGVSSVRLYFKPLSKNPTVLSYDYYGNIVEIEGVIDELNVVSTLGIPTMM